MCDLKNVLMNKEDRWQGKINLKCSFCQHDDKIYTKNSKEVMPIFCDEGKKLIVVLICEECFKKRKEEM